jgi:carbon-monoxide dehydrogenase medium subunit
MVRRHRQGRGLSGISVDGGELVIGATTRHADLASSELVIADAPLLAHAASLVGDPQIRHRGTIGGSLAHADPAADLPMAIVALGGSVELTGPAGTRRVAADDFFTGFFRRRWPGRARDAVRVAPSRDALGLKFVRRAGDWAIVSAAAVDDRIALANMGSVPVRAARRGGAGGARRRAAEAAALATEDNAW